MSLPAAQRVFSSQTLVRSPDHRNHDGSQNDDHHQAREEAGESSTTAIRELESKCKEMESSFFDLQMENIQLKGELERYQKIVEFVD